MQFNYNHFRSAAKSLLTVSPVWQFSLRQKQLLSDPHFVWFPRKNCFVGALLFLLRKFHDRKILHLCLWETVCNCFQRPVSFQHSRLFFHSCCTVNSWRHHGSWLAFSSPPELGDRLAREERRSGNENRLHACFALCLKSNCTQKHRYTENTRSTLQSNSDVACARS